MKVLYIIANLKARNTGKGGSFHSSASVAKAISSNNSIKFVVLGDFRSPAVDQVLKNHYIYIETGSPIKKIMAFFKMLALIVKYSPQIVHIFGNNVLIFAYMSALLTKSKIVYTKCGKGNSEISDSYFSNVITLSQENYIFLQEFLKKGIIKRLTYIPNRIFPFNQDEWLIQELKNDFGLKGDDLIVMRLGRLDKYYESGIDHSIDFYNKKKMNNPSVKLLLIGHRSGNLNLQEKTLDDNIYVIDDLKYTNDPKTLLSVADIVIANGRCTMEACYVGGEILVPSKEEGLIPLTANNWNQLLHYNFSERSVSKSSDKYSGKTAQNLKDIFYENFNIIAAVPKIENFYEDAVYERPGLKPILVWAWLYFNKF